MDKRDKLQHTWSDEAVRNHKEGFKKFILHIFQRCGKIRTTLLTLDKLDLLHKNILISYPDNRIQDSWLADISKFGYTCPNVTFTNISSIKKHTTNKYDVLIFDECFTGDTEILTETGFIKFKDLSKNIKVAQWNNFNISFVNPLRYIHKEYEGEMIDFHIKHGINVPMTSNHEQVYLNNKNYIKKSKIKDIICNQNYKIPVSGKSYIDNSSLSYLERMYIIAQADGSIHKMNTLNTRISFSFSKERKINRFLEILEGSKLPFVEINNSHSSKRRWIVDFPINSTKIISNHINFPMSYNKASEIIEEMVNWDGSIINKNQYCFSSTVKENVDFYNSVAILSGHSCYINIQKDNRKESYKDIYRLFITKDKMTKSMSKMNINNKYNYKGDVYCVEVPSNNIILRHEGYTFVSGNCHTYSENQAKHLLEIIDNTETVLGLSGTISKDTQSKLWQNFNLEPIIHYSSKQAIQDGLISDYSINVITVPLDITVKTKNNKGRLVTEKQQYDAYSYVIDKLKRENKPSMFLALQRNRILQGSISKVKKLKEMISKPGRFLIFTGLSKVADNLGIPSYHSKSKDDKNIDDFLNKKIDKLALAVTGGIGVSYKDLDGIILSNFTYDSQETSQILARALMLDYHDKVANVYIISSDEPAELKKLKATLEDFDQTKIKYNNK